MPWYSNHYDFSFLEVNRFVMFMKLIILTFRDITNICGFTREVLIALLANVETRQWRC